MTTMLQFGSLFTQFPLGFKLTESSSGLNQQQTETPLDFLQRVKKVSGLRKDDVYCNLRVPEQLQAAKDDINIVLLTGHGIFCIDVKTWRGKVSAQNQNWLIEVKEEEKNFTNTRIEQTDDALKAITTKTGNLCRHLKKSGVSVREKLFFPKVVLVSPDCELDQGLRDRKELVSHGQIDDFLRSFREGYVAWISDALTPSWISGHLSYRQMDSVRNILRRVGTWDLVRLHCGEQLKGDYQGCPYIALDRKETDALEFSRVKALSADSLWALLGHTPQVTVKMYKRGAQGWLGKTLAATATIPSTSCIVFRINGEETDAKIPANSINSITLSI